MGSRLPRTGAARAFSMPSVEGHRQKTMGDAPGHTLDRLKDREDKGGSSEPGGGTPSPGTPSLPPASSSVSAPGGRRERLRDV